MVKGDTTSASLKEIYGELERVMSEGSVTAEELERARGGLLKGFPNRFETISSVAGVLSELVSEGREPSWLKRWSEGMPQVSLAQVLKSGERLTPKAQLQVIVAGDYAQHSASVAELGLEIKRYNTRGEPLSAAE
jgi:predicted Zn-dependent peptidase